MIISTLLNKPKSEILIRPPMRKYIFYNELKKILDGSCNIIQLTDGKELEILMIATIVTLRKKIWTKICH